MSERCEGVAQYLRADSWLFCPIMVCLLRPHAYSRPGSVAILRTRTRSRFLSTLLLFHRLIGGRGCGGGRGRGLGSRGDKPILLRYLARNGVSYERGESDGGRDRVGGSD